MDQTGPDSVRRLTIQGHGQPFWAIPKHSQLFRAILQHSGPFLKAISSPHLRLVDRFLVKNIFHADSFYIDHRARETSKSLRAARSAAPSPQGAQRAPGALGGPVGPPRALGRGWGVGHPKLREAAEARTSRNLYLQSSAKAI